MTIDVTKLPYRPCVGIMLLNRDGLVWVGHRADAPGEAEGPGSWWQMPQGGIDEGEDPAAAALRELAEETSVTSARLIGQTVDWHYYDLPPELIGKAWGGRYRGQKQRWFVARFLGSDSEVNISPPGHPIEFDRWRWAERKDLLDLVIPFKRGVYASMLKEIGHLAVAEGATG